MFLISLILGGLIVWLIHVWVNSKFEVWKKRNIPYIPTSPFRLLYDYLFTKKILLEILKEDYNKLDGHRFGGHFMMFSPAIMIRDAELINRVCVKDFTHFVDRAPPSESKDILSQNLFGTTGSRWRALRHKMTPAFTSGKLKMMFVPIKENCDEVISFINRKGNNEAIEAKDTMFKFVINVIGNVSFGLKVDALNEEKKENNEFLNICKLFFQPSFLLFLKFIIATTFPKLIKLFKINVVDKKIDQFFRKLVKDMIAHREKSGEVRNDFLQIMLDQKKKELQDSSQVDSTKNLKAPLLIKQESEEPEDNELLDQLKNMGNEDYKSIKVFTDDSIVSQTFLFIAGGSESTATSLTFVFYNLAQNQKLQKKVQEEVDNIISKYGFTYQAVKYMIYLKQFIDESMRIHTTTPFFTRLCTKDYVIPGTDVVIKKGETITLPIMNIMNDSQYFEESEKFNPDNFKNMDAIRPGTHLTFGIGPRMCIAKRLAMLEMKMLVATVLQHFTVKLSPKTKVPLKTTKSTLFQHVEGGIWLLFENRNV